MNHVLSYTLLLLSPVVTVKRWGVFFRGMLQDVPLHCVKMCHYGWFNKEQNGHQLGRKSLDGTSVYREKESQGHQPDVEEAGWAVQSKGN